jgi:hypothetical protein
MCTPALLNSSPALSKLPWDNQKEVKRNNPDSDSEKDVVISTRSLALLSGRAVGHCQASCWLPLAEGTSVLPLSPLDWKAQKWHIHDYISKIISQRDKWLPPADVVQPGSGNISIHLLGASVFLLSPSIIPSLSMFETLTVMNVPQSQGGRKILQGRSGWPITEFSSCDNLLSGLVGLRSHNASFQTGILSSPDQASLLGGLGSRSLPQRMSGPLLCHLQQETRADWDQRKARQAIWSLPDLPNPGLLPELTGPRERFSRLGMVVPGYHPRYSGGKDQKAQIWGHCMQKVSKTPFQPTNRAWWCQLLRRHK